MDGDREIAIRAGEYARELPGGTVTVTAPGDVYADEIGRALAQLVRSVEDGSAEHAGRPGGKAA